MQSINSLLFGPQSNPWAKAFFYFVASLGAVKILQWTFKLTSFMYSNFIRPCICRQNFMNKYGQVPGQSWVLVTGGSDGIGLEMVNRLAAQGFNICIVARNEEKMRTLCQKIQDQYQVLTKYIVCDLGQAHTIDDYKRIVADEVKDLDLAMVFLNAGICLPGTFQQLSDDSIERIYRINCLHGVYLAKALLPQQMARGKRSAMVVTSAFISILPTPGMAAYSSAKAAASVFAEALHFEVRDKIDVMGWDCGAVNTLANPYQREKGASIKSSVDGCFKDIGYKRLTFGCLWHQFQGWQVSLLSPAMMGKVSIKMSQASHASEDYKKQ